MKLEERLLNLAIAMDRSGAKGRQANADRQDRRAAKVRVKDERLARKHGLTVEEIRVGRAVEATRKRRFGIGIGI